METPLARTLRLVEALETLAGQEATILRSFAPADADRLVALVAQADPLVRALAAQADDPAIATLRPRVTRLLARRASHQEQMADRLGHLRAMLARGEETRMRLNQVAPAYGFTPGAAGRSRFEAAG